MSKSLSIIIPVYNDAPFLQKCLDSIAAQTVAPDEVIVVDNNSTDDSVAVAKSFPFVRVVHESKQGIVYARNAGFDAATSDIIGRLDADTMLSPGWVSRVKQYYGSAQHDDIALTGGGSFYNIRLPRFNSWLQSQLVYRLNRFIVGHYVLWGSNMALPTELWQTVRSDVCLRNDIHEDLDLSFHLHRHGFRVEYKANLRVKVYMKRMFSNRDQLFAYGVMWPTTLRSHGYRRWWLGTLGSYCLWYLGQPLIFILEYGARLTGSKAKGK